MMTDTNAPATPSHDQYADLASLYDVLIPDPDGMLDFYCGLAKEKGGPVLEVGTGTGRLAIVLAKVGHEVVAADISEAMLEVLRSNLARMPHGVGSRVTLTQANQLELDLGRRFPLVLSTGGTLQHCLNDSDWVKALERLRAHLAPDGILALDVAAPPHQLRPGHFTEDFGSYSLSRLTNRWTRVVSWNESHHDAASGVTNTACYFEMFSADGSPTDRFVSKFTYTYPGPETLRDYAARAGLVVERCGGGFRGEPVTEKTRDYVLVARNS